MLNGIDVRIIINMIINPNLYNQRDYWFIIYEYA